MTLQVFLGMLLLSEHIIHKRWSTNHYIYAQFTSIRKEEVHWTDSSRDGDGYQGLESVHVLPINFSVSPYLPRPQSLVFTGGYLS